MKNLSPFCTCTDLGCPLHPTNHDNGCAPCIAKNLKLREIPSCFFNEAVPDKKGGTYFFEDFAAAVLGGDQSPKECVGCPDVGTVEIRKVDRGTKLADMLAEFVAAFSWVEVKDHVLRLIGEWGFDEWETPFAALIDGKIVGMATIMKTDYYPIPDVCPWVSTVFVAEEYRGHGICGRLIDFANEYAKSLGFNRTYIPSEHVGLYEKYGYRFLREITNYGGGVDRLYVKELSAPPSDRGEEHDETDI